MKETVAVAAATEEVLPERIQEILGRLVGVAKEGLLALSVGVGLGVLVELIAEEVDDVVGPVGRHDAQRDSCAPWHHRRGGDPRRAQAPGGASADEDRRPGRPGPAWHLVTCPSTAREGHPGL